MYVFILERGLKPVEKITVTEVSKDNFKCDYVAPDEGPYNVNVSFAGKPVPKSPFHVNVAKTGDAGKCRAQGDGLETAIIDMLAEFDVDCSQAGKIVFFQINVSLSFGFFNNFFHFSLLFLGTITMLCITLNGLPVVTTGNPKQNCRFQIKV